MRTWTRERLNMQYREVNMTAHGGGPFAWWLSSMSSFRLVHWHIHCCCCCCGCKRRSRRRRRRWSFWSFVYIMWMSEECLDTVSSALSSFSSITKSEIGYCPPPVPCHILSLSRHSTVVQLALSYTSSSSSFIHSLIHLWRDIDWKWIKDGSSALRWFTLHSLNFPLHFGFSLPASSADDVA